MVKIAYFDGGLKNKRMTYGWILLENGIEIAKDSGTFYHKKTTANMAEYQAFLELVQYLSANNISDVLIYGDSQTVCFQLTGKRKTKAPHLKDKQKEIKNHLDQIPKYSITWLPGKDNIADRLTRGV